MLTPELTPAEERRAEETREDLESALSKSVEGEVRFDDASRALYATDLSIYRQVPIGVVVPESIDDVVATVRACRERSVPILGRGTGTSLAGQTCNAAVVIDFSKRLNRIVAIDPRARAAEVEPGVICDQLRHAADPYGLTFGPDPATHAYCSLGGMIGNNSCGVHSVMAGKTVDNVEELEVLTYDGLRLRVGATSEAELDRIVREGGRRGRLHARMRALRDRYAGEIRARYPRIPRRVSGYNLDQLLPENGFHVARALVGSESTLALVLRARVRLVPNPPKRSLLVVAYPDAGSAGDDVASFRATGPVGLEAFHTHVLTNMETKKGHAPPGASLLPRGRMWLLVEYGGETQAEASARAKQALARVVHGRREAEILDDPDAQEKVWHIRESCVAVSRVPGIEDTWPAWEDSAVAPERIGEYLRALEALLARYGYAYSLYGHFGDGCVHTRIAFDLKTSAGVAKFRRFMEDAAELVLAFGGSLSGEHGDGQARGELLPRMFGEDLVQAFRELKSAWDPHWRMNPGKVVDAYPLDSNLRGGPDYHPLRVLTHFQYPEDHGSFAEATERCFGIGKCRTLEGGTMCPSFQVLREEKHTTRGRAHLLFEMVRGDALKDAWKNEGVKEALDLCLACKACKGDCPVSVDMATYKAEFLAHYHEGRPLPRTAIAFGLIYRWARLASLAPRLVNALVELPLIGRLLKDFVRIAPERKIPRFADETFRDWFRRRGPKNEGMPEVLLWPDTFANHFTPSVAKSAVLVLENAGRRVVIPDRPLCCGRPLYDYGMLDRAKGLLREILRALRPALERGTPIVVLEPSCASVFRDELGNLFPGDADAARLARQTKLLAEWLDEIGYEPPRLERTAILHGHCHQKAVLDELTSEEKVLRAMGLSLETPDTGCCGMAGSFGYEAPKYEVSMRIGERVLLPKVRSAELSALVLADGFSCRTQIEDATERRGLHLAEAIAMALAYGPKGPPGPFPERVSTELQVRRATPVRAIALGAVAFAALALLGVRRGKRRGRSRR